MVKNTYGIGNIIIRSTAKCYCPLGKDWYTNNFEIEFTPGEYIPDYCESDKWIEENINGKSMIIEEAVDSLYNYLEEMYKPEYLYVTSHVEDAKHSAVIVSK